MIDLHPVLDLHPTDTVTLTVDWDFFWRESTADGVYRLSGSLLKPAGTDNARFVGHSPSLTAVWNPTRHISVLASYVHFSVTVPSNHS
jgi:outer membrane receptor protein involved in Fe transport